MKDDEKHLRKVASEEESGSEPDDDDQLAATDAYYAGVEGEAGKTTNKECRGV